MAWNQPGKGNQDPWKGKDPGNEVEAFVNRLKGMFGGGGGGGDRASGGGSSGFNPLPWVLVLIGVWVVFNSFKLMDERQRGVVLRFGEFNRIMTPGPNFKWPWPIETVEVVDATQVLTLSEQVRVLTKDENIVDIKFNAQYTKSDPRMFLFGSRDPEQTLQQAAESAVREAVGMNTMDTVLFERAELVVIARQRLQESLMAYDTGLVLTEFNLPDARPPEEVKPAFDDAISAREDKSRIENEAMAYASKIVPEARGQAAVVRTGAEGYRAAIIARAEGDTERFRLLADEYRKAPEVTRKRLYLETMQLVLASNDKVMAGSENNILYLPIGSSQGRPAAPVEAPVLRMPATQAATPETPNQAAERARVDGRQRGR
jgi:membrane protease subunit HflK